MGRGGGGQVYGRQCLRYNHMYICIYELIYIIHARVCLCHARLERDHRSEQRHAHALAHWRRERLWRAGRCAVPPFK